MKTVENAKTLPGALQQLNAWKMKVNIEQRKGVISANTICGLNRAYMVYRTKIINQPKAA